MADPGRLPLPLHLDRPLHSVAIESGKVIPETFAYFYSGSLNTELLLAGALSGSSCGSALEVVGMWSTLPVSPLN